MGLGQFNSIKPLILMTLAALSHMFDFAADEQLDAAGNATEKPGVSFPAHRLQRRNLLSPPFGGAAVLCTWLLHA